MPSATTTTNQLFAPMKLAWDVAISEKGTWPLVKREPVNSKGNLSTPADKMLRENHPKKSFPDVFLPHWIARCPYTQRSVRLF